MNASLKFCVQHKDQWYTYRLGFSIKLEYSRQHINESKVLHTYVMNEILTAFCSRLTKYF